MTKHLEFLNQPIKWISIAFCVIIVGWAVAIIQEANKFKPVSKYTRAMATSYILAIVWIGLEAYTRLNEKLSWRAPFALGVLIFGLIAMYYYWRYYRLEAREQRHNKRAGKWRILLYCGILICMI